MSGVFLRALSAAALATAVFAGPAAGETPLERGTYLMRSVVACGNCHTPQGPNGPVPGMELAGGLPLPEPGMFMAFSPNITPDKETGIGNWTDAQIAAAIREGKRPDGTIIGPPMPIEQYRGMSDSDVAAIIAYLRSVKPVRNKVEKSQYQIPLPPSWGPPVGHVADVPRTDKVAYGAYLAGPLGHCVECHTPLVQGRFDYEKQFGAGGNRFHGPWGTSVSANLTANAEEGLSRYSDAEVKQMITTGTRPDGSPMAPPMAYPYYRNISQTDLEALVAYLRTLPAKASPE